MSMRKWRQTANETLKGAGDGDQHEKKLGLSAKLVLTLGLLMFMLAFVSVLVYLFASTVNGIGPGMVVVTFNVVILMTQLPALYAILRGEVLFLVLHAALQLITGVAMVTLGVFVIADGQYEGTKKKRVGDACAGSDCTLAQMDHSTLLGLALIVCGAVPLVAFLLSMLVFVVIGTERPNKPFKLSKERSERTDFRQHSAPDIALQSALPSSQISSTQMTTESTQPTTEGATSCSCQSGCCQLCSAHVDAYHGCACSKASDLCTCTSSVQLADDRDVATAVSCDVSNKPSLDLSNELSPTQMSNRVQPSDVSVSGCSHKVDPPLCQNSAHSAGDITATETVLPGLGHGRRTT